MDKVKITVDGVDKFISRSSAEELGLVERQGEHVVLGGIYQHTRWGRDGKDDYRILMLKGDGKYIMYNLTGEVKLTFIRREDIKKTYTYTGKMLIDALSI